MASILAGRTGEHYTRHNEMDSNRGGELALQQHDDFHFDARLPLLLFWQDNVRRAALVRLGALHGAAVEARRELAGQREAVERIVGHGCFERRATPRTG